MGSWQFPIRLKIMVSLLLALTAVVIAITFTMAGFFHEDKRSYMNDWLSIAVVSTAQESRSLLEGYASQLRVSAAILLESADRKQAKRLVQEAFRNFPQLIEISLYRDGKQLDSVSDTEILGAVGLSADSLRAHRAEHPLPIEEILAGQTYVANSTLVEDLPAFTLALSHETAPGEAPVVVAAVIGLEDLLQLGAKFKVFEITLTTSDGILLTHPDARQVAARGRASALPEETLAHGFKEAGLTREFTRDGIEMLGGVAPVDFAGITAAAVMPRAAAYLASRTLLGRLLLVTATCLLLVAIAGRLGARRITRPIERLSEATRKIGRGDFDIQVDVRSRDEIGTLSKSFNRMASELNDRETALKEAHTQLLQSEKMAAFGQLGAGIAHEVKNPLAGILGCAQLSLMEVEGGSFLHTNLSLIEKETDRCKTIIENLLRFARQEKAVMELIDVNDVARDAASITNHQLEINQVRLERDLASSLPPIQGNANQLQQVLMNLIMNAQQAMKGQRGTVTLTTRHVGPDKVEVCVSDTGPGIPAEVQRKIFEPFFTTKPTGEGTGLGLSVSFGIIEDHGGKIAVESEPGKGATFRITLPSLLQAEGAATKAQAESLAVV